MRFPKGSHVPSCPSLALPGHQSWTGPVPPQSSKASSPRTEPQEYGHKTPNKLGVGSWPVWWERCSRAIAGFSASRVWALRSRGRRDPGVGVCKVGGSSVPGSASPPFSPGWWRSTGTRVGQWAARGGAHGEAGEWLAVGLKQSDSCLSAGGRGLRERAGPSRSAGAQGTGLRAAASHGVPTRRLRLPAAGPGFVLDGASEQRGC